VFIDSPPVGSGHICPVRADIHVRLYLSPVKVEIRFRNQSASKISYDLTDAWPQRSPTKYP